MWSAQLHLTTNAGKNTRNLFPKQQTRETFAEKFTWHLLPVLAFKETFAGKITWHLWSKARFRETNAGEFTEFVVKKPCFQKRKNNTADCTVRRRGMLAQSANTVQPAEYLIIARRLKSRAQRVYGFNRPADCNSEELQRIMQPAALHPSCGYA